MLIGLTQQKILDFQKMGQEKKEAKNQSPHQVRIVRVNNNNYEGYSVASGLDSHRLGELGGMVHHDRAGRKLTKSAIVLSLTLLLTTVALSYYNSLRYLNVKTSSNSNLAQNQNRWNLFSAEVFSYIFNNLNQQKTKPFDSHSTDIPNGRSKDFSNPQSSPTDSNAIHPHSQFKLRVAKYTPPIVESATPKPKSVKSKLRLAQVFHHGSLSEFDLKTAFDSNPSAHSKLSFSYGGDILASHRGFFRVFNVSDSITDSDESSFHVAGYEGIIPMWSAASPAFQQREYLKSQQKEGSFSNSNASPEDKIEITHKNYLMPDMKDKDTILSLARMTSNSYTEPEKGDWKSIPPWNMVRGFYLLL
jgi:hypothetical protein